MFDPELAVKAFAYAAQDGLKQYYKEFGADSLGIQRGLIQKTLMAVGKELLDHYMDEIKYEPNQRQQGGI